MKREKTNVQIIPYENSHRDAFMDINYQWLTQYFEVTAYDKPFFENPRKEILDKSGYIFLASLENEIVGSVALERITDKQYTLAKMGVKPGFQGLRIGQLLMDKALEKAEELNLESLVLYTNHQLFQALNLYSKYGFRFEKLENQLVERATIKMVKKFV